MFIDAEKQSFQTAINKLMEIKYFIFNIVKSMQAKELENLTNFNNLRQRKNILRLLQLNTNKMIKYNYSSAGFKIKMIVKIKRVGQDQINKTTIKRCHK